MDDSAQDQMERYESLAEKERQYRSEKQTVLESVGDELTAAAETALSDVGASVAVESTGNGGNTQTLAARFDHAELVSRLIEELPQGFSVKRLNDDGTLTIEWDRHDELSPEQRAKTLLKVLVSEMLETDADDFITSAPTKDAVIERAKELDIPESLAEDRLQRLESLDVIDISEGEVYPDKNFSTI